MPSLIYKEQAFTEVQIQLPASKSISNRLLILQKIAESDIDIQNLSTANDTIILKEILYPANLPLVIDCQDAGTVYRFLCCLCAALPHQFVFLEGTPRLLTRPMKPLLECLEELGAEFEISFVQEKMASLMVKGAVLKNKKLCIAGDVSSQFISGLCLIAPLIENGLSLRIEPPILSKPYIELTLSLLRQFGIKSTFEKNHIRIPQQKLMPRDMRVESDWSSATFFYCFMMLAPNAPSVFLEDIAASDIQGDKFIAKLCEDFGVQTVFAKEGAILSQKKISAQLPSEIDLSNFPDLAVPFIVACAFKFPQTKFKGLAHLRSKESDRIKALQLNLENFGILLKERTGQLWFEKKKDFLPKNCIDIQTFNDHRIAMTFSIVAVLGYEIALDNLGCIDKSFPNFIHQISKVGIGLKK